MVSATPSAITTLCERFALPFAPASQEARLEVFASATGDVIAALPMDNAASLSQKIMAASAAQRRFVARPRREREQLLQAYSAALKQERELLAQLIHIDAGKTLKEALVEADGSADILLKTITDASLADLGGMQRTKERPPVGVVGLITSFNFPLVVAHWTIAPALLAGNAVLWKPSEKTPMVALAIKAIFDKACPDNADLLQLVIGGRDIGEALVAHEAVDMISATGSVGMGEGIKATLARKKNNAVAPILELGGNNGVIIAPSCTPAHLEFAVSSIISSFLGTTGQRCTNTRRLIVHRDHIEAVIKNFQTQIAAFLAQHGHADGFTPDNPYGYGPLIDKDAYERFTHALQQVAAQGGRVIGGERLYADQFAHGYYVAPALAILPQQTDIMHHETFAPILFITSYEGEIAQAATLLNAPANSGLVAGLYTLSQSDVDYVARHCDAGHLVVNSPKGTGTPAYGMGFGGNKASGTGEILNSNDPLQAFTRAGKFTRIAINGDVALT